jgi:predicted ATPase/DNA-binding CsgD family transcriptional regulator
MTQPLPSPSRPRSLSDVLPPGAGAEAGLGLPSFAHTLVSLPAERTRLVGRSGESAALLALLRDEQPRLITLAGPGGAGKTTLALHAAWSARPFFPGGVVFINLAPLSRPEAIPEAIVQAVRLADPRKAWLQAEALPGFLAERRLLLVLDNLEHLAEGAARLVDELLNRCPRLHILGASREALRLRGEHVFPVRPLPLPASSAPADIEHSPAVSLFIERLRGANPDFHLTPENAAPVAEICRRLDGLPLALELAARWGRLFTPQALLERLRSAPALHMLTGGPRDLPERQQTLRAAIAWSYALLAPEQQRLFVCAALFPAGFTLDIIGQTLGLDEPAVLEGTLALIEKNLLLPASESSPPRFAMLETIRQFAQEQAENAPELPRWQAGLAAAFDALARRCAAGIQGPEQTAHLDRLQVEFENLTALMEWAAASADRIALQTGLSLAGALEFFWLLRGRQEEGYQLTMRLLRLAETSPWELDAAVLAQAYSAAGTLAWSRADYAQSAHCHLSGLALFCQAGDESGMAATLGNLGVCFNNLGDMEQAHALYAESLACARRAGNRFRQAQTLNNLGNLFEVQHDFANAAACYQETLQLGLALQAPLFQCLSWHNLGDVARCEQRWEDAAHFYGQALQAARQSANEYMQVVTLTQMAVLHLLQDQPLLAAQELQAILPQSQEIGNRVTLARGYAGLALALAGLGGDYASPAAMLLAFTDTLPHKTHGQTGVDEQPLHAQAAAQVRQALGPRRWAECCARGQALTLPQALELVVGLKLPSQPPASPASHPAPQPPDASAWQRLTRSEAEVARLVALGKSNEQIAVQQHVVVKTVEKHITSILRKLQLNNRTELAAWVISRQIR